MKSSPTVFGDYPEWIQREVAKLSDARRNTFTRFIREMKLQGASPETVKGYVKVIRSLGHDGKPYEELTSEDLMAWMERIGSNGWSIETVNWHRRKVKHFLRWLGGCQSLRDKTPEPARVIQQHKNKALPKPVLSRKEVRQLLDVCHHQRDRALVYTTYESGARAGEILAVKIKDVEFDQYGAVLRLNQSKTEPRRIRLVESVPDLRLWLSMHLDGDNPEAWLWPSLKGGKGALQRDGYEILLRNLGKKAGLKRHVHPHLLRHSRATYDATYMSDAQMRVKYGWSKRSRMPEVYTHLSGSDLDETVLKHYGVRIAPPKDGDLLEPRTCSWCKATSSPSARFCQQCNAPLDSVSASEEMEKQRRRAEFVDRFIERILQEVPDQSKNVLMEMRKELAELAE